MLTGTLRPERPCSLTQTPLLMTSGTATAWRARLVGVLAMCVLTTPRIRPSSASTLDPAASTCIVHGDRLGLPCARPMNGLAVLCAEAALVVPVQCMQLKIV